MLNKVQLIGRTGKEPEVRYTTAGDAVTNVSLATTESWQVLLWRCFDAFASSVYFDWPATNINGNNKLRV